MRELRIKEVKRSCGVRGCPNTAKDGRVFSIMRTSEAGAGMAIMCEHCIKDAYEKIFGNSEEKPEAKEPAAETPKKPASKRTKPKE